MQNKSLLDHTKWQQNDLLHFSTFNKTKEQQKGQNKGKNHLSQVSEFTLTLSWFTV